MSGVRIALASCVCLVVVLGAGPAAADSRCDALEGLVPATVAVVTGDLDGAAKEARVLRELAKRELVPRRVKPALRKLARFFERAPKRSVVERARALGDISGALVVIAEYAARTCPSVGTTTTTRPLR